MVRTFGRDPAVLGRITARIRSLATELRRCLKLFEHPLTVVRAYIGRTPYPGDRIVLNHGMGALHLANRTEDVITTFVVLVRDDYGPIKPGAVVLDIGANIGVFAVKALMDGAALVYCVEPSPSSVRALTRTVASCPRSDAVIIDDRALWGADGHTVFMPQGSSPSAISHVATSDTVTVGVSTVSSATLTGESRNSRGISNREAWFWCRMLRRRSKASTTGCWSFATPYTRHDTERDRPAHDHPCAATAHPISAIARWFARQATPLATRSATSA